MALGAWALKVVGFRDGIRNLRNPKYGARVTLRVGSRWTLAVRCPPGAEKIRREDPMQTNMRMLCNVCIRVCACGRRVWVCVHACAAFTAFTCMH